MKEDLKDLFAAIDKAFSEVQEQFADEVQCRKGCDDCCHSVFDISLAEAAGILEHFQALEPQDQQEIISAASEALASWDEISRNEADISKARIRCPLLNKEGYCFCYEVRPVNCRTYGIPTVIGGAGHVCGLSGFEPGMNYPSVNLEQLQKILFDFSVRLGGENLGCQRWPLAAILLDPEIIKI